jgi:DNA-binding NarL/FixJ family response regulator
MEPIRVLLVDDEASVRRGLRLRLGLEPDLRVVGEATNGASALDVAASVNPNVVVMDIEMSGGDGITATRLLTRSNPSVRVVILSIHDSAQFRGQATRAGAAAFVGKHESSERLIQAIRNAGREEDTS